MRAFLVALALLFVPMVGRAAEEQPEPCPAGWEPGSPLYSQVLIVPPLVACPSWSPCRRAGLRKNPSGNWPSTRSGCCGKNFRDSIERLEVAYAIDPQPLFCSTWRRRFGSLTIHGKPSSTISGFSSSLQPSAGSGSQRLRGDMRVLLIEQERTVMARRLLELEQARQTGSRASALSPKAEEEKRVLAEQLRKAAACLQACMVLGSGSAAAVTATAIESGVLRQDSRVDGGFVDIHFRRI